ncbi:MAG: hypothetical protein ACR2JB_03685 [Bryobacteraceae bacterium]
MIVRISTWQLACTLLLSVSSFLFGFALSRYIIDLSLREADAVILRSAHQLERYEQTLMKHFGAEYGLLDRKLNGMKRPKERDR